LDRAFRIALGDLTGNILPYKGGILKHPVPCIMAGLDYDTPWTRDSSINVWNAAALLVPKVAKNTLLSVLMKDETGQLRIGGQYWDAIIWVTGAWNYYLVTGDKEFLKSAFEVSRNSLFHFEKTEWDKEHQLFRGPACYGDGVGAYPDAYTHTKNGSSGIEDWVAANPGLRAKTGFGIPMLALSTNCLYAQAYSIMPLMEKSLGWSHGTDWHSKAVRLKKSIRKNFWMPQKGTFRYLADKLGACEHQEGLGHAFVLLFGICDKKQAASVLKNQHITNAGIPCIWPPFERYRKNKDHYGRHAGTVWPHIQGFWAEACARAGLTEAFNREMTALAAHADRDSHFAEIYHPDTGKMYGGLQEFVDDPAFAFYFAGLDRSAIPEYEKSHIREWNSCRRQTWSATAFLRMIFQGLCGITFHETGISFHPCVPPETGPVRLVGLPYKTALLDIILTGSGTRISQFKLDGKKRKPFFLPTAGGRHTVEITMRK
jgi:glycogen debranching enzyme